MSQTANVFNIQHFSLQDGPGIRTVVFLKGCPLDCAWCHNPESKSVKPELSFLVESCSNCRKCAAICAKGVHFFDEQANEMHQIDRSRCVLCGQCTEVCSHSALKILGKTRSLEEIMSDIAKDDIFFGDTGGVTFSGGEPFLQFDALYELLQLCKQQGYSTCIETSGFAVPDHIVKSTAYTDYYLFDCKETDPERHKKYVGADNQRILSNLSLLNEKNAFVILRCPIIPGINDRTDHFLKIAELTAQYTCIKSVEFMPYHPLGIAKNQQIGKQSSYQNNSFMDKEKLESELAAIQNRFCVPVKIN